MLQKEILMAPLETLWYSQKNLSLYPDSASQLLATGLKGNLLKMPVNFSFLHM